MINSNICKVDGCSKSVYVKKHNLCITHYNRMRMYGSLEKPDNSEKLRLKWEEHFLKRLKEKYNNTIIMTGKYIKDNVHTEFKCITCGESFIKTPNAMIYGKNGCYNCNNVRKHRERKHDKIGKKFKNKKNLEYTLIEINKEQDLFLIRFESGYEEWVTYYSLRTGYVTDYNQPSYYGVGCLGMKNGTKHHLYHRWFNMIGRCYNKKHCGYSSYGGKGVTVEPYLTNFKNYVDHVSKLDNYDKLLENTKEWNIDKDISGNNQKEYSRKTLLIVHYLDNLEEENRHKRIPVLQIDDDENIINSFNSITEAEQLTGISKGNIASCIRGERNKAGGFAWRENDIKK